MAKKVRVSLTGIADELESVVAVVPSADEFDNVVQEVIRRWTLSLRRHHPHYRRGGPHRLTAAFPCSPPGLGPGAGFRSQEGQSGPDLRL